MSAISALTVRGNSVGVREYIEELTTAAAEREEREEEDRVRSRPYTLRQRIDPMVFYEDEEFVERFRLSKERTVSCAVVLIEADIRPDTEQNAALSPTYLHCKF